MGLRIVIRADATGEIGTGHVMRCLALGQACLAHGDGVTYLSRCEGPGLARRISETGADFDPLAPGASEAEDIAATLDALERNDADWLVLDGYHFSPSFHRAVREAGRRLLVIDDTAHLPSYGANVILNQNLGAERLTYRSPPETILLLGVRYALLRPEFLRWSQWRREFPAKARRVLVTMGGSDPDNVTEKVIEGLIELGDPKVDTVVLLGAANPHGADVERMAAKSPGPLRVVRDASDVTELMAWADLAISAGGSTCWELAFMGLPFLVLVIAENQRGAAQGLERSGVAVNLGDAAALPAKGIAEALRAAIDDVPGRRRSSRRGRTLVDGRGASRVREALLAGSRLAAQGGAPC